MYDTDTINAMASGLGEALADGVEPIYSESYGEPVTLELTEEQEKALSAALIKDLGTLYTHALSFYLSKIPQEDARGGAVDQITFFVCVPPYIPLEKKRQTIELLNNTMVREVGYKGEMKVIVLFQYHDDEGVGKDGELFADFKARQAQQ